MSLGPSNDESVRRVDRLTVRAGRDGGRDVYRSRFCVHDLDLIALPSAFHLPGIIHDLIRRVALQIFQTKRRALQAGMGSLSDLVPRQSIGLWSHIGLGATSMRDSVFDLTGRLSPVLPGLPLILPALRVAFLVSGATILRRAPWRGS